MERPLPFILTLFYADIFKVFAGANGRYNLSDVSFALCSPL